jgi:hypothetical protein
MTYCTDG